VLGVVALPASGAEDKKDYPPQARARFDQGQEFQKQGKWKEALQAYEDALRLGMNDFPRAHLYRARAQLALKDYEAAITRYTEFIESFGLEKSCRY
jgi:tetratricopeptide (TPR) repeat protein